jgi:hypothetical protein
MRLLWAYESNIYIYTEQNIETQHDPMFHELNLNVPEFVYTHKKNVIYLFVFINVCTDLFTSLLVSISPLSRSSIHLTAVVYQYVD